MRKMLTFGLLSLLVLAMSCEADSPPNEDNSWTGANLRGRVKSVTEVGFQASNQSGEWVKNIRNQIYNVKNYTASGFLSRERSYYSDTNELTTGFDYVYDAQGNVTRINMIDPAGNVAGYSDIQEREGKVGIKSYTDFFGIGSDAINTGKTELTWENYKLKSSSTYSATGELMSGTTYEYDKDGNVSVFSVKNFGNGQRDVTIKSTYLTFDEKNNWLSQLKEYEGYPVTEILERRYEYYE